MSSPEELQKEVRGFIDENLPQELRVGNRKDLPGAQLYAKHCAECHSVSIARAPHKSFLAMLSGDMIMRSMNAGLMQPMAKER